MNRAQRRASGLRCHDCGGRNVVVQADYGWLCDPCWIKREQSIEKLVMAGAAAVRPIDRDRPAPPCAAKPHPLAAHCGHDAVAVVQVAKNGEVIDYAACERHMGNAIGTVIAGGA